MKRLHARGRRGFTLLEIMVSSVLGIIVITIALGGALQLQRRALFEEQTMMAQVTGRAVKEVLAADLQRAGLGMGNAPITFADGDLRFAIQAWTEPNLAANLLPYFPADATFALPPAGTPYVDMKSDALQLYWGDTRNMIVMDACTGKTVIREGNSFTFCTAPDPSTALDPPNGQTTPAIIVNPQGNVACHLEISNVMSSSGKFNANPGSAIGNTGTPPCGDADDPAWGDTGWMTLRTQSSAYRVNWASGTPTLEYRAPGSAAWVAMARDVERMKVRQAITNLASPLAAYRWFPDAASGRPAIDQCTRTTCTADTGSSPASDAELRRMLQQRVREVEVTLTIRTRRADLSAYDAAKPMTYDDEGFPVDGFKRRTFTFRVTPRNFAAGGLVSTVSSTGAGT
jgi:type IV pilus assembly protein PilW